MRQCRFCSEPLPEEYPNNVWYCQENDCQKFSKNLRSYLYYWNIKDADKQLKDNTIISLLAKQNGVDVYIDWPIPTSMGFTWDSYSTIEVINGLTVFVLPSYNYAIFENKKIKIYKNEITN